MKHFAWISWVGLLLVAAGSNSGCTVTTVSSDGGDDGAFGQESSTTGDAAAQPETSTSPESGATTDATGTPDTGVTPDSATPDAGAMADASDGGACPVLQSVTFGSAACDQCLGDHCCSESTTCFTGSENECESAVSCFLDCIVGKPDAGIAPGDSTSCKSSCAGLDAMASAFDAWVSCTANNCASTCQ
jgi:hypothetical protein